MPQLSCTHCTLLLMIPAISIVMPVWNGEEFLAEAVESILGQTFSDFELIVVDDGSTDGTLDLLHGYRDPRLKIHQLSHSGIVVALNHGIANSQAAWIARQDADDFSFPDRLEKQWNAVRNDPEAVLCFTNIELLSTSRRVLTQPRFPGTQALLALRMCFQCPITHSSVLFRKETFQKVGGYQERERHAEDFAAWGRLMEVGHIIGLPERLVKLRIHDGSVSQRNLSTQVALTQKIATTHCERFMQLDHETAVRAHAALAAQSPTSGFMDWVWFLARCAPRLRSQSIEMWAWLGLQTLKRAVGRH